MNKKEFKLTPVSSIPLPIQKEKKRKDKFDEQQKKYLDAIGYKPVTANSYKSYKPIGAEYIQEIYKRKKEEKEKEKDV